MKHAPSPRQRANVLSHLPAVLAELGVPLGPVLHGTGIAPADLVPEAFLPYDGVLTMLAQAAEHSGCTDIGLRLGGRQTLASLGPAGRIMGHARTLGEALSDFVRLQISNSTGSAVYIYRTTTDFALGYAIYSAGGPISPHIHDLVLATGCRLVDELTQGAVKPIELWTMRPEPPDLAPYHRLATCPIRFGQEQTCMFLSAAALDFALPGADGAAHAAALAAMAAQLRTGPWQTSDRVRHTLRGLMLAGRTQMDQVAGHLGLHPRTLRRALAREGTDFESIRDEVRYAAARELLQMRALSVSQIAITLNYASVSAFSHAFRRWTGSSPRQWQAQAD